MNPEIRDARPEEAAEIAALIRASITDLCARDHRNEPNALAAWLANKTPETVASWIAAPDQRLIVARGLERAPARGAPARAAWGRGEKAHILPAWPQVGALVRNVATATAAAHRGRRSRGW